MGRITTQLFCVVLLTVLCTSTCLGLKTKEDKLRFYELKKGNFTVKLTNWGASLVSVIYPDKYGKCADVLLGYDTIKQYQNDTQYLGALLGRVANRIGGAQFKLKGKTYNVTANEGNNTLHGGKRGFTRRAWKVERYITKGPRPYITFSIFSPDGEEGWYVRCLIYENPGFPGALIVKATYIIVRNYQLKLIMSAKALNKATPVNMAAHPYWNLAGHNTGDILSHKIKIFGTQITPTDDAAIPTGEFKSVKGTPYDFLKFHVIGSRIKKLPFGYNINYVLDADKSPKARWLKRAAIVVHKKSGRRMAILTNAPGVQFYSSHWLDNVVGKGGFVYKPSAGLALETQNYPDAVNHPNFPSSIVYPGQTYKHCMLFKFSVVKD